MTGRITGTGSYVPENIITNDDLAKIVDTNDEWIRTRTGIGERRIATTDGTAKMAEKAARNALENAGVEAEELEIIILATSTPEYCFPNVACQVQAAIGAVNAVAFDLSAACSGFVFALNTLQAYIKAGIYRKGLVIGVDNLSKLTDWADRGTCVLFGDGAGAAVVEASDIGFIDSVIGSDGSKGDVLTCLSRSNGNFLLEKEPQMGYMQMNGQEVFKFAVKKVPECITQVIDKNSISLEDIKYFVLHQANYRICEAVAKRLSQSLEKIPMNIEKYGNTSAATVPILLDELNRAGKISKNDKIVLSGFGGGLTWGAVLLEW